MLGNTFILSRTGEIYFKGIFLSLSIRTFINNRIEEWEIFGDRRRSSGIGGDFWGSEEISGDGRGLRGWEEISLGMGGYLRRSEEISGDRRRTLEIGVELQGSEEIFWDQRKFLEIIGEL